MLGLEGGAYIMRKGLYIIIVVALFPFTSFARGLPPFSGRVSVSVNANENIKGEIESYISRELRSLGDIIVTDNNPRWVLNIVALEVSTKGGYKSGVLLSIVILEPFDSSLLMDLVGDKNKQNKQLIYVMTLDLYSFSGHWLRVGAPEDLRKICNAIVADFDTEYIKPARDSWQNIIDYQKKKTKKP